MEETHESELRDAEMQQIAAETEKLRSEKEKIDAERREIEGRLRLPFYKRREFYIQLFTFAVATIPLAWFYVEVVVQPFIEAKKLEIDFLTIQYRRDTTRLKAQKRDLDGQYALLDSSDKSKLATINLLETTIKKDSEINERVKANYLSALSKLRRQYDSSLAKEIPMFPQSSTSKPPITQEEFEKMINSAPQGKSVVIANRSGTLSIGDYDGVKFPRDLSFEFEGCDFRSINFQQTTQNKVTFSRCNIRSLTLTTNANLYSMKVTNSSVTVLRTIDGSRCLDLELIGGSIGAIINDMGADPRGFQNITFRRSSL